MNTSKFFDGEIRKRPNKEISVFWVMSLKILGRVGTHF